MGVGGRQPCSAPPAPDSSEDCPPPHIQAGCTQPSAGREAGALSLGSNTMLGTVEAQSVASPELAVSPERPVTHSCSTARTHKLRSVRTTMGWLC